MKIKNLKLKIVGMHCTSCCMNIDFTLENLEGIKKAQTNYVKQETEVEFDEEKITFQKIIDQVSKIGYKASQI